jgi:hypothetical protein
MFPIFVSVSCLTPSSQNQLCINFESCLTICIHLFYFQKEEVLSAKTISTDMIYLVVRNSASFLFGDYI